AMLSTTWFLAHVVAITFVLLGITLALDAERQFNARRRVQRFDRTMNGPRSALSETIEQSSLFLAWFRRLRDNIDPFQFMAGFVFGLGALARLPVIFGAPFFLFVGGGGSYWKRGLSAALGAIIPVTLLLIYNLASSGHIFNPAYEWLYQTASGYVPPSLTIDTSLGIEDPRHIPTNALIMFAWPPDVLPEGSECGVGLLNPTCPLLTPSRFGMSLLLSSPAYLLALPLTLVAWRRRLVLGSALAVISIALLNLMHFSQGWVQFGYRFSNDFAPFALVLVTLAIAWLGARSKIAIALVAAAIIINAWGVYWGVTLGW
ncbi:MAG: hypothetical protein WD830_01430, partial [Chloroflexota bacterium]